MPLPVRIPSDDTLPVKSSVVVIGGGIVGVATALELAERGIEVTLCEKAEIACEQSSRNWGWCRQMGRDPREIPLIVESLKAWRAINARVQAETGFRECGILYLCETEAEIAARTGWFEQNAKPYGLPIRFIAAPEVAELAPGATVRWKGALYSPHDGRAEPEMAAAAMAAAARRSGAKIFTHCAVRGLQTSAGRLTAVVTEKGPIACDSAVLAAGAWSRLFLKNAGFSFPQLTVVNSVMRTKPPPVESSPFASASMAATRLPTGICRLPMSFPKVFLCFFISCRLCCSIGKASSCASASVSLRLQSCSAAGRWTNHRRSKNFACSIPNLSIGCWMWPSPV
jgi:glycine/D-amino acid oxidase-like deaminating enzyme